MNNLSNVRDAALQLDADQRAALVDALVNSLAVDPELLHDSEFFSKWLAQAERRWEALGNLDQIVKHQLAEADSRGAAIDLGELSTSDASDVLKRMRGLLRR